MTTPVLDLAALTAPIAEDQPAGVRLLSDTRKKMEEGRKEFEPNPDDPSGAPIPKKPDWSAIIKLACDSLTKTSKDLLAAVRLVEAIAQRDGFAGLREGLSLLRLLVTDCWDRMHPLIEEPEDIEARAGPFEWLSDPESGAWFPQTIGKLPLVRVGGQLASLKDCQSGQRGDQPLAGDELRAAEPATPTTAEDIAECLKELAGLDQALVEKMADQAPTLVTLRDVLSAAQNYLKHLAAPAAAENQEAGADGLAGGSSDGSIQKAAGQTSRAETYRLLARLADDLARLEPHSPIPDLLRWAVKLGNMPFRQLIQEFVREPAVLTDIRRQFGIPEPEASEAESS
jgi:type VI secretion system protein ImpA